MQLKTIAVDSSIIPYESVVYIKEAEGVKNKINGEIFIQDSYFFAADAGSQIKGNHIDIFIGYAINNPFAFIRSSKDQNFQQK